MIAAVWHLDASILTHTAHQGVPIWIVHVILVGVDSELVIYSEHLCFPQTLFLRLLLFEFLELEMSAKSPHHNNLLIIVHDPRISLGLKSALVELLEFALPSFSRDPLLLLFQAPF